jgi:peptidoglycan hydrolase-like protein with peptidoglycan-binding domain
MAFTMPSGELDNPTVFNLNFAVGVRKPNRKDDVLLVQRLLQLVGFPLFTGGLPVNSSAKISVDGIFGPQTDSMIKAYEENLVRDGRTFFIRDGIMNSASPDGGVPGTDVTYKIIILNVDARERNPNEYVNLPFDDTNPPALRQALLKGAIKPPRSPI